MGKLIIDRLLYIILYYIIIINYKINKTTNNNKTFLHNLTYNFTNNTYTIGFAIVGIIEDGVDCSNERHIAH